MHGRVFTIALLLIAALPAAAQCKPEDGNGAYLSIVRHVRFDDTQTVTTAEGKAIAHELAGFCFDRNLPGKMLDRIRDAFQRHGYFKVVVLDRLRVTVINASAHPNPVDLAAVVNEGDRYWLGDIQFRGDKAFDAKTLRPLIPLKRGDIVDVEKVRQGLKALRDLYGDHGYINFTPIPDAQIDGTSHTISLVIDCDEGKQFAIAGVEFSAPRDFVGRLREAWKLKIGDAYSSGYVAKFFADNRELMPSGAVPGQNLEVEQHNQTNTVVVRLKLCSSGQDCVQERLRLTAAGEGAR
ncbi:MAG TPA: POTRA domain-containing protein [Terriglobales bacterium]